jgi:hypothetical protein
MPIYWGSHFRQKKNGQGKFSFRYENSLIKLPKQW